MDKKSMLHIAAGALLLMLAALIAYDVYQGSRSQQPPKSLETAGKVLVALLTGIGGLYVLSSKQKHDVGIVKLQASIQEGQASQAASVQTGIEMLKGSITQLNNSISAEQGLRSTILAEVAKKYIAEDFEPRLKQMEIAASSKKKYVELVYEDDFRRRDRRDAALMALSRSVRATTRAFRVLTKFRLSDGMPSELLVNTLAQALAAREHFLTSREELVVLHAVDPEHEKVLRAYSNLLIDVIIDVRRPSHEVPKSIADYETLMSKHEIDLEHLDTKVGELLAVFLAPQQRRS